MSLISKLKQKAKGYSEILLIIFIIALLVSLGRNVVKINKVSKTIEEAQEKVKKLRQENQMLADQAAMAESQEYIEKQLRNELGLVKEDEIVLILPEENILRKLAPKKEEEEETLPDPNWKEWVYLFF
jgi:cell division protein FtsB